jgi:hypothetical protein
MSDIVDPDDLKLASVDRASGSNDVFPPSAGVVRNRGRDVFRRRDAAKYGNDGRSTTPDDLEAYFRLILEEWCSV